MDLPILSEDAFVAGERAAAQHVRELATQYGVDTQNPLYGAAFRHYLLFSLPAETLRKSLPDLDAAHVFYNQYHWFLRFTRLYMQEHGYDAGLEQQGFQLIENVDFPVDWRIVDGITGDAD